MSADAEVPTFRDPLVERLARFIHDIGLRIEPARLEAASFLPGILVRDGAILVDEAQLAWPGDLLHEAGHLAVSPPDVRAALPAVGDDPAEEMAALAWSYAAARHLGIDPAIVFHPAGYKGGAAALLAAFEFSQGPGLPILEWLGMTLGRRAAAAAGAEPFPRMLRWLR